MSPNQCEIDQYQFLPSEDEGDADRIGYGRYQDSENSVLEGLEIGNDLISNAVFLCVADKRILTS